MRTNIVLDENILRNAFKLTRTKTKKGLIQEALTEFIANRTRKNLGELKGKIAFLPGYQYKSARRGI